MWYTKLRGKNVTELKNEEKQPAGFFLYIKGTLNNGTAFDFSSLKGKKVLLVNTASDCGYTDQYDDIAKNV